MTNFRNFYPVLVLHFAESRGHIGNNDIGKNWMVIRRDWHKIVVFQ